LAQLPTPMIATRTRSSLRGVFPFLDDIGFVVLLSAGASRRSARISLMSSFVFVRRSAARC
jgi:hypothetical protein